MNLTYLMGERLRLFGDYEIDPGKLEEEVLHMLSEAESGS